MRELLDRHLGDGWLRARRRPADVGRGRRDSGRTSCGRRAAPARASWSSFVRERSVADRLARGDVREYVEAAARGVRSRRADDRLRAAGGDLQAARAADPRPRVDAVAARRRAARAGRARRQGPPARRGGQARRSSACSGSRTRRIVGERVVFLDDYDLASAARLVRGCDVWLNLPRPPLEASGTSGMKSAFNGGLQLSVLDGWWAEAYDGDNGWALPGEVDPDPATQDERDADDLPPAARRRGRAGVLRSERAANARTVAGRDAGLATIAYRPDSLRPGCCRSMLEDRIADGEFGPSFGKVGSVKGVFNLDWPREFRWHTFRTLQISPQSSSPTCPRSRTERLIPPVAVKSRRGSLPRRTCAPCTSANGGRRDPPPGPRHRSRSRGAPRADRVRAPQPARAHPPAVRVRRSRGGGDRGRRSGAGADRSVGHAGRAIGQPGGRARAPRPGGARADRRPQSSGVAPSAGRPGRLLPQLGERFRLARAGNAHRRHTTVVRR